MLFRNRRMLEQDLERIRRDSLPSDVLEQEDKKAEQERQAIKAAAGELTFKDYLAMVIAVLSIIVPYLVVFIAVIAVIVFLAYKFYL